MQKPTKRIKKPKNSPVSISLPILWDQELDRMADDRNQNKSFIVREALDKMYKFSELV